MRSPAWRQAHHLASPTLPEPLGLTCQDGLVHSKCGGLDLDEAEVSRYLVSHCTGRRAWLRVVGALAPAKPRRLPEARLEPEEES